MPSHFNDSYYSTSVVEDRGVKWVSGKVPYSKNSPNAKPKKQMAMIEMIYSNAVHFHPARPLTFQPRIDPKLNMLRCGGVR